MEPSPSTNGSNGRDFRGRFTKGNSGGPGNPLAGKVLSLRKALFSALSQKDIREIINAMVFSAKQGNVAAAKFLFSYTLGQPLPIEELERYAERADGAKLRAQMNALSIEELLILAGRTEDDSKGE